MKIMARRVAAEKKKWRAEFVEDDEKVVVIVFCVIGFVEKRLILVFPKTHFPGFLEILFYLSMF